jgi:proteic killer suppression protein
MISGFADHGSRDIYDGEDTRAARRVLPKELWGKARVKLDLLEAAHELRDLMAPPSNRMEKLKGDLAGKYSIRINDQYRLVFRFENGNANDVEIVDYH